jgi:DNA-binding transcriptional regulator YhcF (GntR family)
VVTSLAINPNTASKAYRELETKGLIVGRSGQGTFILATLSQTALYQVLRSAPAQVSGEEGGGPNLHALVA